MPSGEEMFERACTAFEAAHAEDPRSDQTASGTVPHAIRYHAAMAKWVDKLDADAPLEARLAARCQHIRRWLIPRSDYPQGRTGYKKWRSTLAMRHAEQAAEILSAAGYADDVIARVGELLIKKRLRTDPTVQLLENAICLTFLELEYVEFAAKHEPDKVISIVQKTWGKMSKPGHDMALALVGEVKSRNLWPAESVDILERALAPS